MSVATTICERCCTLHIAGRHSKCFRDLTEERRAELMRGMRGGEAEAGKMRDGTCEASSRRLHARERGMAGWWRDFSGNGAPDFEFTVESADEGLARNLVWAKRFDSARQGGAR